MKVLIAEDELLHRRVLEKTLARWGYEVVVCSDGSQAWGKLQDEAAPDMAILDWMMPGMNGTEICRRNAFRSPSPVDLHNSTDRQREQRRCSRRLSGGGGRLPDQAFRC